MEACKKFPEMNFRFCWLVGAILDEEDKDNMKDMKEMKKSKIKEFRIHHEKDINDEELYSNVISRIHN